MKILQICPQVPYPPIDGGKVGIFNITKPLVERGHEITMIALSKEKDSGQWDVLKKICTLKVLQHDNSNSLGKAIENLTSQVPYTISKYHDPAIMELILQMFSKNSFDIVHVDSLHCAYYGMQIQKRFAVPVVLRMHDYVTAMMERFSAYQRNPVVKIFARMQIKKLRAYEGHVCERFDCCLMVSQEDEKKLQEIAPNVRTAIIPPGIDTKYFVPSKTASKKKTILFYGALNWLPNLDSLRWFVEDIFPIILERIPDVTLEIAGSGGLAAEEFIKKPNIRFLGFVEDIRQTIVECEIAVIPLRIGSGVRLKILELFAMGKPVVSTTLGAEGTGARNREELLLADSVADFAETVVLLLNEQLLCESLSTRARQFVVDNFDRSTIAQSIEREYEKAIKSPKKFNNKVE